MSESEMLEMLRRLKSRFHAKIIQPDDLSRQAHEEILRLLNRVRELEEERRWRKWPEEEPEKTGCRYPYTVIADWYPAQATFHSGRWFLDEKRSDDDITDKVTHFRAIGELPEGRQNVDRRAGNEIPN